MRTFDHLRWHLVLALGGALLVERLHGPFATTVLAVIAADRLGTMIVHQLRARRRRPRPDVPSPRADDQRPLDPTRPRHSIALMRTLGADCATCRGFGCRMCAYTGLN